VSAIPTGASPAITYRRAGIADAERTFQIVQEAQNHLNRSMGRPDGKALPAERVIRLRHFCVRHDGERFWVAEAEGQMIGAAYATLRDDVWYLDALHVVPGYQSRKVGSELLRRSLSGTGPGTALTVLTDSMNPVSNGLYMRFGMLPQESTVTFDGPIGNGGADAPARAETPSPAAARSHAAASSPAAAAAAPGEPERRLSARPVSASRDAGALAALDLATVGFARPTDHEFWLGVPGLEARIVERGGAVRGYLYVSGGGAIGPVAVADPRDLPAALDIAAEIAAGAGAGSLHVRIFGSARGAVDWAVRRGLRLTAMGLMLSSRPVGRFEGYVTSGADALY
jgi:ribosomal protein S18 acetylase RimI-like enzyme